MDFLYEGRSPANAADRERCISISNWLTIGQGGELMLVTKEGRLKVVPPIAERQQII